MVRDFGRKPASLCALAAAYFVLLLWTSIASGLELRVRDNHLVDRGGKVIRLLGVNRSGAEYACIQGYGFFDGPTDQQSIRAMKSWHINAVRVPLNEDCWLGINGVKPEFGGAPYRQAIEAFVARLNRAGLYVILDLHVAAPGSEKAVGIIPLPDADHAPDFWRSVAATFASNHSLAFDLYNEPHDVGWDCWLRGCMLPAGGEGSQQHPAYRAAGMQDLVDAVRSTGAQQPVMAGGRGYARNLAGWLAHRPLDPAGQLAASEHNYGRLAPCGPSCKQAIVGVARVNPVVVGELGETDCRHGYIDRWLPWADRHGISYLGWTWDAVAPGSWTCGGGPSLIENYEGKPTPFGIGFRNHLRALARR
jgi:endoglucanase